MERRKFTRTASLGLIGMAAFGIGCKDSNQKIAKAIVESKSPFFKLSLAQWSFHRAIQGGSMDPFSFAAKAKSLDFEGVEYVNQLYNKYLETAASPLAGVKSMTKKLKEQSDAYDITNVLIMVDGEGDLGVQDQKARKEGVENHKKWIDAAHALDCQSVRINLFGKGTRAQQLEASSESLAALGKYCEKLGINVIVENHGGFSSDPKWMTDVMKNVNMPNVGTLPDFGNFCIEREGGERWGTPCINEYPDIYEAVTMMMPYAKSVSAKSHEFDADGNETRIDYSRMMKIIKEAGYKGFIGVEYEGESADEVKGIKATRDLLLKSI